MSENSFNKRIKLSQEILGKIGRIDEFKGLWHGSLRLSPQILGRLKSSVIITSTGASTRIEGSKMSDVQRVELARQQAEGILQAVSLSLRLPDVRHPLEYAFTSDCARPDPPDQMLNRVEPRS